MNKHMATDARGSLAAMSSMSSSMPPTLRIAQLLVDTIPNLQKALAAVDVAHLDVQALHAICKKNSIVLTQDQQAYLMYGTCYLHDLAYIDRHPRAPKTSKDDLVKWLIHQFLIPATSLLRDWQSSVRDRDRDRDRSMSKPRWSDNFAVSSLGDDASSGDDESEDAYDDAHDEDSFNVALEPKVPVSVTRWVDAGMKEFFAPPASHGVGRRETFRPLWPGFRCGYGKNPWLCTPPRCGLRGCGSSRGQVKRTPKNFSQPDASHAVLAGHSQCWCLFQLSTPS